MKTIRFYSSLAVLAALVSFASTSFAQVGFTLHGTLASPTLDDVNNKVRPGIGAGLKFFVSPNVAVGASAKYISLKYDKTEAVGQELTNNTSLVPITGTLDLYLTKGAIRPYIGGEAGAYIRSTKVKFNGNEISSSSSTKFGAAPKAGIMFALGNLGVFAEGTYHFIFGSKDGSANTGSPNNIEWKNPDKLWGLNVGVTFGIPN